MAPPRTAGGVGWPNLRTGVCFSTIFDMAELAASAVPAVSRDFQSVTDMPRGRLTSQPRDTVPAYIDRRLALSSGRNSLVSGRGDALRSVSPYMPRSLARPM